MITLRHAFKALYQYPLRAAGDNGIIRDKQLYNFTPANLDS